VAQVGADPVNGPRTADWRAGDSTDWAICVHLNRAAGQPGPGNSRRSART